MCSRRRGTVEPNAESGSGPPIGCCTLASYRDSSGALGSLAAMPRIRAGSIEEHKVLTRRQILEAARVLLAETGNGDINLGDLAAVAGIGRTTLYEYFKDRDDLIASLVEDALPGVIAGLVARMDSGKRRTNSFSTWRNLWWSSSQPIRCWE